MEKSRKRFVKRCPLLGHKVLFLSAYLRAASQVGAVAEHVAQRNFAHNRDKTFVAHGVLNRREQLQFTLGREALR
jgi:hypothetical protein